MFACRLVALIVANAFPVAVPAGPPYVIDDPEPTDYQHYEIYIFSQGTGGRAGNRGAYGIDFNCGAAENLRLTASLPIAHATAAG